MHAVGIATVAYLQYKNNYLGSCMVKIKCILKFGLHRILLTVDNDLKSGYISDITS